MKTVTDILLEQTAHCRTHVDLDGFVDSGKWDAILRTPGIDRCEFFYVWDTIRNDMRPMASRYEE